MKSRLVISSAVRTALKNHEPIVALESTILTHGLPRPTNLEVAQRCEAAVKSSGSVPATIFLYKGKIHIGASEEELFELCQCDDAVKVSRRDFAKVLSGSGWGGTTIAGTVLAANLSGIDLMATGGLGGVHRGAEISFDISADLSELGRTPVAVVSSGVKKILDVQKTLEVLETQGVGTYTIGDSDAFPDFYMRDSGLKSHGGAISIEEAGKILAVNREVGISSGIVFANPVPKDSEGDGIFISGLIDEALLEAGRQNITGPASTPFILSKLAELSGGKTVEINVRLVENNCLVGGQIAKEFALQRNSWCV
ncbi:unnamed protein product [Oikopleura dioica]|uniref:Pseudouridine-5'-phosphate glycosidase n=1 Tax=Oikopleura dioica TaxID=34765 RepID=E4X7T7_OIKDI|nr:unnamed protein product [Oikopleura dioica]